MATNALMKPGDQCGCCALSDSLISASGIVSSGIWSSAKRIFSRAIVHLHFLTKQGVFQLMIIHRWTTHEPEEFVSAGRQRYSSYRRCQVFKCHVSRASASRVQALLP